MTEMIEKCARAAARGLGYDWDTLYENKTEWTADRGSRHDINVPFKPDFREAAAAVIDTLNQPTLGMLEAAETAFTGSEYLGMQPTMKRGLVKAYRAMLSKAKSE